MKELFVTALLTIARSAVGDVEEAEIPVMVRHEDAVEQKATEAEKKEGEGSGDAEPAPKKRTIPEVDIPAPVKDNLLLKVVRAHLKTLLDEMDNTKEEDWSSSKTQSGGIPGAKPALVVRG